MPNDDSAPSKLRTGRDWHAWESDMESMLRKEGVWPVVSGSATAANSASAAGGGSVALRDTFTERDSRAVGTIRMYLSPSVVRQFKTHTTSKALWDALKAKYATANQTEVAYSLLQQLQRIRLHLDDGSNNVKLAVMTKHVERVAEMFDRLDNLGTGYAVNADLQPLFLLGTLPNTPEFRALRSSITGSVTSGSMLTLEDAENKLLAHAEPDEESDASDVDVAANTAVASSSDKWCHFHKVNTHTTAECKAIKAAEAARSAPKGKGKPKPKPKRDQANKADASDSDSGEEGNVAFVSSTLYKKISA